jgi:hypothetical protein
VRRTRSIALICVIIYVSIVILSVVAAHVLVIAWPQSGLGERVIGPVAKGLEFLDSHWKSVLILVTPFFAPVLRDLIRRLRKAGPYEFDPVPLEAEGVREKPAKVRPGASR